MLDIFLNAPFNIYFAIVCYLYYRIPGIPKQVKAVNYWILNKLDHFEIENNFAVNKKAMSPQNNITSEQTKMFKQMWF